MEKDLTDEGDDATVLDATWLAATSAELTDRVQLIMWNVHPNQLELGDGWNSYFMIKHFVVEGVEALAVSLDS